MYKYLVPIIDQFEGKKILIIGDIGLDQYIIGDVTRISQEAPVLILDQKSSQIRLGLASNIAQNIKCLNASPHLISVIGNDENGNYIKTCVNIQHISNSLYIENERVTTTKTRIISNNQQLLRFDHEEKHPIPKYIKDNILNTINQTIKDYDCIIFEDYGKGLLTKSIVQSTINHAKENNIPTILDPTKTSNLDWYEGIDYITPNTMEFNILNDKYILKEIVNKEIIITMGKNGYMFENDKIEVPSFTKKVVDVTGAGDTFVSILALGLASKLNLKDSCLLANFGSAVVVNQFGTSAISPNELKEFINGYN